LRLGDDPTQVRHPLHTGKVLLDLHKLPGEFEFSRLFEVILTDNGSEFSAPGSIEFSTLTGEQLSYVFYCNPNSSWQKGALEKNHEYIRYVLPNQNKRRQKQRPYEVFSFAKATFTHLLPPDGARLATTSWVAISIRNPSPSIFCDQVSEQLQIQLHIHAVFVRLSGQCFAVPLSSAIIDPSQ
ncbi:MAG: hypothetical protein Q4F96_05225, partial [Bacillota bacterium]|nr:hypothetical protein [Bacillota bacterium]